MSEVTLTLKDVESKDVNTKRGLSTVYRLKGSDGRTYTTFDRELAVKASEMRGKTVTFDYVESQNGDYTNYNLNGVKEADPTASIDTTRLTTNDAPYIGHSPATPSTDKDTSIARAVALKAAVETSSFTGDLDVIGIANTYVDWLLNGPAVVGDTVEADTSNLVPF